MAVEPTAVPLPQTPARRESVPPLRALRAVLHFSAQKPLGGFGVAIIILMFLVAFLAPLIERYDPKEVFQVPNPEYDAELAERALTDRTVRLTFPPEKFDPVVIA